MDAPLLLGTIVPCNQPHFALSHSPSKVGDYSLYIPSSWQWPVNRADSILPDGCEGTTERFCFTPHEASDANKVGQTSWQWQSQ